MKNTPHRKQNESSLINFPEDILKIIFKNLDYPSCYYLKHTNRFFAKNMNFKREMSGDKLIESTRFVCGHENTFVLSGNGELYACGNNQQGQLGLYDCVNKEELHYISLKGKKISDIAVNYNSTYLLSTDSQVYAAGLIEDKITPYFRHIPFPFLVKQIAVGSQHVLLLSTEGKLYGYGCNKYGQLGLASTIKSINRSDVLDNHLLPNVRIKNIMANHESTVIEAFDRNLYVCGSNIDGKIGAGAIEYQYGFLSLLQNLPFSQTGPIKQVSLSETNLLVLFKNGKVYGCGSDEYYELGGIGNHDYSDAEYEGSDVEIYPLGGRVITRSAFVEYLSELPLNKKVEKILAGYKTSLFMLNNNVWYFYGLLNGSGSSYDVTQLTLADLFWFNKEFLAKNGDRDIQAALIDKAHNIFVYKKEAQLFGMLKPEGENQGQIGKDDEYSQEPSVMMDLKRSYF